MKASPPLISVSLTTSFIVLASSIFGKLTLYSEKSLAPATNASRSFEVWKDCSHSLLDMFPN